MPKKPSVKSVTIRKGQFTYHISRVEGTHRTFYVAQRDGGEDRIFQTKKALKKHYPSIANEIEEKF